MAVAVGLPGDTALRRPGHRPAPAPSFARDRLAASGARGRSPGGPWEACDAPYVSALVRHASARGRTRHPYRPGAPGTQRRQHDDDLHTRAQPRALARDEPRRSSPGSVTPHRAVAPISEYTDLCISGPGWSVLRQVGVCAALFCVCFDGLRSRYAARYAARRGYAVLWN